MADIEFDDPGDFGDRSDRIESQAVPGVAFEPDAFGVAGGLADALKFGLARGTRQ